MQVCTLLGEGRLDGLGEALEAVDAGDEDVVDAAAAQVVEDGQPELGALGFLPPQAEDLALAVAGDPQGEVAGAALDRAVLTDLHEHGVEVDDRIDRLQRPRAPRDHVVEDGVGDPADRVAPDVDAVELAQMRRDVTDRHPAGVEAEDLVVQPRQPRLTLGDEPGLKAARAIPRGPDLNRPQIGADRFAPRALAHVRALRHPARRMPEMLGQLRPQGSLDHAAGELAQQAARTSDLVGLKALQRVLERVGRKQLGEPVDRRIRRTLRSIRALSTISRRIRDGVDGHRCPSRPQGPNRSPRPHTLHRTDPRDLVRCADDLRCARTAARHRIAKQLLRHGQIFREGKKSWTKQHVAWVRRQRLDDTNSQRALEHMLCHLDALDAQIAAIEHQLEQLATTEPWSDPVRWLTSFRGIGLRTALGLLAELGDFKRFAAARELMAYLGLVPSEYSSADQQHRGHLTKTGNRHARRLLVEAAWHYQHPPRRSTRANALAEHVPPDVTARARQAQIRLHHRHRHLTAHGKRSTVATAAIARELAGFIWAAMTHQPLREEAAA